MISIISADSAPQWFNGLMEEVGVMEGRLKHEGHERGISVSWLSPLFVVFMFQSPPHERLIRKKRGQTPTLAFLFAIRRQPSASTRIPQ
jgi:hypothetical protein